MTPSFIGALRGRCWVINCPNVNIVVSQGLRRPEETGMAGRGGSQNTPHILVELLVLLECFLMIQNVDSSHIKDHRSQTPIRRAITMGKFKILRGLPKCDTETWREQVLLEKWCRWTHWTQGPTDLQYVRLWYL